MDDQLNNQIAVWQLLFMIVAIFLLGITSTVKINRKVDIDGAYKTGYDRGWIEGNANWKSKRKKK